MDNDLCVYAAAGGRVCAAGIEYSNTGYIVLGGIVEAVSGQGVDLLLQSRISARAGLTSTSFTVARNSPRFAHPYETQVAWAPAYLHSVHRGERPSHAAVPCHVVPCRACCVVPERLGPGDSCSVQSNGRLLDLWVPGWGINTDTLGPLWTDGGIATTAVELAKFADALHRYATHWTGMGARTMVIRVRGKTWGLEGLEVVLCAGFVCEMVP